LHIKTTGSGFAARKPPPLLPAFAPSLSGSRPGDALAALLAFRLVTPPRTVPPAGFKQFPTPEHGQLLNLEAESTLLFAIATGVHTAGVGRQPYSTAD
jgi:hypothetical protein